MHSYPPAAPVTASLDDPRYYLTNFRFVLDWVVARYGDLLSADEHATLARLERLPSASLSLLTRMVMRKGQRFRLDKLRYAEIGDTRKALAPLIEAGLVDDAPRLDLVELLMSSEDKFGISVPDEDYEKIVTVGDAIAYVAAKTYQ